MDRPPPSFFILVPGPWTTTSDLRELGEVSGLDLQLDPEVPLKPGDCRLEIVSDTSGFGDALSWGCDGPLPEEVVARAAAVSNAALVEIVGRLDERVEQLLSAGQYLRARGGTAVRMEASGGASTWEPWLTRLSSGDVHELVRAATLIVRDPDRDSFFTCGMHQFSLPDAELSGIAADDCAYWLEVLCHFQVDAAPVLRSGHTIRGPEPAGTRRLVRWPDHRHHEHDGRCNPFGLWRAEPTTEPGLEAQAPEPVIIPSVIATLRALEGKLRRPLTRQEVESVVTDQPTPDDVGATRLAVCPGGRWSRTAPSTWS